MHFPATAIVIFPLVRNILLPVLERERNGGLARGRKTKKWLLLFSCSLALASIRVKS